eukprot:g31451.t1
MRDDRVGRATGLRASDSTTGVIFDEASASSIRGSWFHELLADPRPKEMLGGWEDKEGPCKLCETLAPTFLGFSDALRAVAFHPELDGEWALLDFALRATRTPLLEAHRTGPTSRSPGWRHRAGRFAACPHVALREEPSLGGPHLYARRDLPKGLAPNFHWFGEEASALGEVQRSQSRRLKPHKLGVRYIVTDGVLLGSYKFGGMLDWDADVVRGAQVQERRPPGVGRVGSRPPDREVSLLSHTRSEKDPIARLQVRMDQDHRAVFSLELWQTVGHLEDGEPPDSERPVVDLV